MSCGEDCPCRLDWETAEAEDFVDAIERHNPEGVCIEHDGQCKRVPCCKTKPGETAEPGDW